MTSVTAVAEDTRLVILTLLGSEGFEKSLGEEGDGFSPLVSKGIDVFLNKFTLICKKYYSGKGSD